MILQATMAAPLERTEWADRALFAATKTLMKSIASSSVAIHYAT